MHPRVVTIEFGTCEWVGKCPKNVKKWAKKAEEVSYHDQRVFLSCKKDLKPYKTLKERHINHK